MSSPFEPTPGYQVFLAHLVKARTDRHVTQQELADRLGLPLEIVSAFESGEKHLDFVRTRYWCQALGVSFTEFVLEVEAAMLAAQPQLEPNPTALDELKSDDSENPMGDL